MFLAFLMVLALAVTGFFAVMYVLMFVVERKRPRTVFNEEYEKERAQNYPPAYPNGWFSLCSSNQVKKGQVMEVEAFGQKLAVFRGANGKVGVLDVYCPHLNANLAGGKVKGNNLVCPFHAWEFATNGHCAHIPYTDKVPANARTRSWIVKETWGLVLVWYHANNEQPEWDTEGCIPEVSEYKYHGTMTDTLRIHLQDFAENGADFAHFHYVHNLLTVPIAKKFIDVRHTVSINFGEGADKHTASFTDQADLVWKKSRKEIPHAGGNAVVTYYGPGFLVFRFATKIGKVLLLKTFTPVGVLQVKMEDHIYAPKGTFPLAIKYILNEASAQFHDDIAIWERKNYAVKPLLVKGDGPIMKMRTWYSQFYSAPASPPVTATKSQVACPVEV